MHKKCESIVTESVNVLRCRGGVDMDPSSSDGASGHQNWRSLPHIPATPAHDKMKELLHKRNLTGQNLWSTQKENQLLSKW